MNLLDNEAIIPKKIKDVMLKIIEAHPPVVFCGSIALNALGLLDRPVSDIDIAILDEISWNKCLISKIDGLSVYPLSNFSITTTDIDGNDIQRMSVTIDDIKVCIFKLPIEQLECVEVYMFSEIKSKTSSITEIRQVRLGIQLPKYAIRSKENYADKDQKHFNDMFVIRKTLDLIKYYFEDLDFGYNEIGVKQKVFRYDEIDELEKENDGLSKDVIIAFKHKNNSENTTTTSGYYDFDDNEWHHYSAEHEIPESIVWMHMPKELLENL